MATNVRNLTMKSVDELFTTQEMRDNEIKEQVKTVSLNELHPFKDHPFKVKDDEEMIKTVASVARYGVVTPLLVRPKGKEYEIVSGHRRYRACQLAEVERVPVLARELDDDEAICIMVDANLQREEILPSERAYAYKMKLDAIKRQAGRPSKDNVSQLGTQKRSDEIIGEESGQSRNQVQRFIRLTELVPELMDKVDERKIAFNPAVELSYLPHELQYQLMDVMEQEESTPSLSQAQRLKKAAQENKLDRNGMELVLQEEKHVEIAVTLKGVRFEKYFNKGSTPKEREDLVVKALEFYDRHLQRKRDRASER